jgi:photosystem II stability/assembly factor-like uncharacterized protein
LQRILQIVTAAALLASAAPAPAHDPSAWGGLFRSRDDGGAWLPADAGLFVGAALALAVSPTDANHLLYGTDARLLRSRNGGRDWEPQSAQIFNGPTLAVAFAADGHGAWAATPAGVYFSGAADSAWARCDVPDVALPGRALAPGRLPGRVYLLGARGVYASDAQAGGVAAGPGVGGRFVRIGRDELPDEAGRALLVVVSAEAETLLAVVGGRLWASTDGGASWSPRDAGLPAGEVQALAADREQPGRLWVATHNRVQVSDDLGAHWRPWGEPIAEGRVDIHGLATAQSGARIVLTAHRGLLRSTDSGRTWAQAEGVLPVHLEAGPLVADPHDAHTLYAGFALAPYAELRRRAEQGSQLLSQVDPVSLAGAGAFLLLLLIGGTWGARRLALAHRDS